MAIKKKEKPNCGEESKSTKTACSGSFAPGFVNREHAAAEIIDRTMHVHHEALLGHRLHHLESGGISAASQLCPWGQPWEERAQQVCCFGCSASQARIENIWVCKSYGSLSFLPASPLVPCLPWVQWAVCTVRYSETTGVMNRVSKTPTNAVYRRVTLQIQGHIHTSWKWNKEKTYYASDNLKKADNMRK